MKDFRRWLNESVLPNIQTAIDTLKDRKDQKQLVRRIQLADPYQDKRFAPIIARWIVDHNVTPEEHAEDVALFKSLHRRLKDLKVPANNRERTKKVRQLLSMKPEDFAHHYSTLQDWNRTASDILEPQKDLSDEGLPVVMRHDGYTMYRIDKKKHCRVPLVRNSMSWCITKGHFGGHGGPPYYPVVRDRDRSPFAIIIPAHFDKDPDQAVRNAQNTDRLSTQDLVKIRPLVQHALPLDRHNHPYIKGIHGIKDRLPDKPSAKEALDAIKDLALQPGDWPEGEHAISQHPEYAYLYALHVLKGPFPAGEHAIASDPEYAYPYAKNVLKGPFPEGEHAISQDPDLARQYANNVIKGTAATHKPTARRPADAPGPATPR